jgi:hypothetical protein
MEIWRSQERARRTVVTAIVLCVYLLLVAWYPYISSTEAEIKVNASLSNVSLPACVQTF